MSVLLKLPNNGPSFGPAVFFRFATLIFFFSLEMAHEPPNHNDCIAYYTKRDLILYAMGIGCDPDEVSERKYLYERHEAFSAFPLFPLALSFRAIQRQDDKNIRAVGIASEKYFDIPPFPPPSMSMQNFDGLSSSSNSMLLHLGQKFWSHEPLPSTYVDAESNNVSAVPMMTSTKVVSIQPKKKGLLIVSETDFSIPIAFDNEKNRSMEPHDGVIHPNHTVATSQTTTLYLLPTVIVSKIPAFVNLPNRSNLNAVDVPPKKKVVRTIMKKHDPNHVQSHDIPSNQAFLYRLSGDSNPIHVDDRQVPPMFGGKPILHGLCTLGYAVRSVLLYCNGQDDWDLKFADCQFVSPLFVGDSIDVCIWDMTYHTGSSCDKSRPINCTDKRWVLFQVRQASEGTVLVDNGMVLLHKKPEQNYLGPDIVQSKL